MFRRLLSSTSTFFSIAICFFTIVAVNFYVMQPQAALALFVAMGMVLCFLNFPIAKWAQYPDFDRTPDTEQRWQRARMIWTADRILAVLLAIASACCFGYVFANTEEWDVFMRFWPRGQSLANRAGQETPLDLAVAYVGVLLVLEATRRTIGLIVPVLAILVMLHARFGPMMPDWLLPHAGFEPREIVSNVFLQSMGVLGPAAKVMFSFVFLFVLFGAFLDMSGATRFVIDFSQRLFGRSPGGAAKVSVLGSGLMGVLSGSAVANAVTTGSFTIPMMKNSGYPPHVAGGITAAAAAGGALVPPVMGAAAYMMLEYVQPTVTFLEIARAALFPSVLYYFSLWMMVHLYSRRLGTQTVEQVSAKKRPLSAFEASVFFGALGFLILLLVIGKSPFRAVTGALALILVLSTLNPASDVDRRSRRWALVCFFVVLLLHQLTQLLPVSIFDRAPWLRGLVASSWTNPATQQVVWETAFDSLLVSTFMAMLALLVFGLCHAAWRPQVVQAMKKSANNGVSLVAASACVGIIIGVLMLTPAVNAFTLEIKGLVESSLLLALVGIMACSILLGMGVPSVVCYLLLAMLMGSLLSEMGVPPLAAHMFIFYFGLMSMVTPPVALAAYASASIAESPIMKTSWEAFRFSLVGFTLPYMFVYRPSLLLMQADGGALTWGDVPTVVFSVLVAVLGIVALAIGLIGYFRAKLPFAQRVLAFVAAGLALVPRVVIAGRDIGLWVDLAGIALLFTVMTMNARSAKRAAEMQTH